MEDDQVPVFELVDPLSICYGNTLAGVFSSGNKIALWPHRPINSSTRDEPTENDNKFPIQINFIEDEFIFHEPILCSLAAESCSVFTAWQDIKKRCTRAEYTNISRTYRSVIRACLEKLHTAFNDAKEKENNNDCEKYRNLVKLLYTIECIWHLIEILFVDVTPSNVILPQLLSWVRFHFPTYELKATDLLMKGREASEDEDYWPVLKGLLTQGQIDVTRALLQLHPSTDSAVFLLANQILKTMPTYNCYSTHSLTKFRAQWEYWLSETKRKLESNLLASEPNLEELILLVTCNINTWNTYLKNADCWYGCLPGYLYFSNPACKHFELGSLAHKFIDHWATVKRVNMNDLLHSFLDRAVLHLLDSNLIKVISEIQKINDNQWFATHIIDLIYSSGHFETANNGLQPDCTQLRDCLVFDYGANLMTRNNMWQIGMDYLDNCGQEGKAGLEIALAKIPIRSENEAFKILAACQKRGFIETERTICKILSMKSLSIKQYGNAVVWAVRSKDALYVATLADFILKHYTQTGEMLCPEVISHLGGTIFISPRLVFLVKYFDYCHYFKKKEFLLAAKLLINLLKSKITPEYFCPTMLIDCIPLLQDKKIQILSDETTTITRHLEITLSPLIEKQFKMEEQKSEEPSTFLKDHRLGNIEELQKLLHLACTLNLARSYITEKTILD